MSVRAMVPLWIFGVGGVDIIGLGVGGVFGLMVRRWFGGGKGRIEVGKETRGRGGEADHEMSGRW